MAVSDSAKVDLLYKKLFGVAKTDLPGNKSPSNEAIASPSLSRIDKLWTQALSIPATAAATTGIVQAYTGASAVQCTADATTTPISSVYPSWKTNLTDWIPSEFGSTYFVQVWVDSSGVANPTSTGTQIFDSGIAGVGEWNFDYQSGVLNFIGGTIPAALTSSKVIYIVGYRYIGYKATNFANITVGNINISGNTISSSTGNVYISGNLTINGPAVSIGTSDLAIQDPILNLHTFANLAPLTYNDGYDIGLKMHYYDGADTHAFLGRGNDTGYLEWYASGNDTANVFVGTAYGTIKTGELILANTTVATGANTGGALHVWGGAAIAGNVFVGNILTDGYCYSNGAPFTSYTNADVAAYLPTYTGNISAGNVLVQNTVYANTISANVGNVVTISGTGALTVPVGSTAQRPAGANGQIRYNTDDGSLEYYTAVGGWLPVRNVVIDQAITGDGTTTQFTLSQPATATGLLVSVNGVLQNPNIGAYTVAGDQITFSEAPLASDSIDVRFIASLTSMPGTISNDLSVLGNLTVTGNITSLTGIYTYGNTQVAQYLNHLSGNIVPSSNVTYSLGTSTNQWRDLWVSNNTIYIGNTPLTVSGGTLLVNNSPITGGSGTNYTNSNVTAYIPTDSTITALQANLGATQIWANANIASINANLGSYYTWANANVAGLSNSITGANASIAILQANLGSYYTWANANVAGLQTSITSLRTNANANTAAYLAAGISTNVTTTGNISAGNVLINGALTSFGTVNPAYIVVGLASSIVGFGVGSTVVFDTVVGNVNSQASYNSSTGVFTLTAGVTYDMSFTPSFITFTNTTGGYACYEWVDATTNTPLDSTGTGIGTGVPNTETAAQQDNLTARVIYNPTTNQTVKLRVTSGNGTVTLRGGIGTQAVVQPLNRPFALQSNITFANVTATNTANVGNLITTSGIYWANGTAWSSTTGTTYSNANVAAYLTAGNISIGNVGYTVLPNTVTQFTSNVNSYGQINAQNINSGSAATTDIIVTANNGTDTVFFADLGIAGSAYNVNSPNNSLGNVIYANDTYLYAQGNTSANIGGNLAIGAATAGRTVTIFAGGINKSSNVATFANTGVTVYGNVAANYFTGNGSALTGITTAVAGNIYGTSSNVTLVANTYSYTFANTGTASFPGLLNITSTANTNADSQLVLQGNVYRGGAGYHDFLRATNTNSGATNTNKYFRLNSTGQLQIINSAYTTNLFTLDDSGNLTVPGTITATSGVMAVPDWTSAGAITIGATTTAPTKPTTRVKDNISYRQVGAKQWEVIMSWLVTSATGAANGSGDFLFTLPNSLQFDTTLPSQSAYTTVASSTWSHTAYTIPSGSGIITNNTVGGQVFPMVYSSTQFRILAVTSGSGVQAWGSGFFAMTDYTAMQLTFRFTSA